MKKETKISNQDWIDSYDPDDIIIPNSIWGEIYYIYCVWKEMGKCSGLEYFEKEKNLKRQIHIFLSWMCHK